MPPRSRPARLSLVALSLAASGLGCAPENPGFARAMVISRVDEGVGGPKASAWPGDFLLENDHLRVAILGSVRPDGTPRYSLGPGLYGGALVDADLQPRSAEFAGGRGLDQFGEMFATASMNIAAASGPADVWVVADGSDGGPAVIRVEAEATPFLSMLAALWAITAVPDMRLVTDYIAEPGVPYITMRTAVRVGPSANAAPFGESFPAALPADGHKETFPLMSRAVETGLVLGDFYLQGGSVAVFAPGMGFDEDGLVAREGAKGRNSFSDPFQFPWVGGVADRVSYVIEPVGGDAFVPLFTSSQTAIIGASVEGSGGEGPRFRDGDVFSYERRFYVGEGDIGSIWDQMLVARGEPTGEVRGFVMEEGLERPLSGADVFVYRPGEAYPISMWRTDVRRDDRVPDGSFGGLLPVGDWELMVHREGRPDSARVPITVQAGSEQVLRLGSPRAGTVTFTIRDEVGERVPAKVTFVRQGGTSTRRPELGDAFIAGDPEAVVFPMYGTGTVELPDGEYVAIASRGAEYEIDVVGPFRVDAQRAAQIDFEVERSVLTEGWISADFHVHAAPSHDAGISLVDRVRTMASEGVEFFSSTDHDVITDYAPVIEDLGLEAWVQSAVGVETTTVELGHFLSFPLERDFAAENGGAMDWTGRNPYEITTTLREAGRRVGSEPIVFVGHPRAGILGYFDQYGVDTYSGRPGVAGEPGSPTVVTPTLALANPLLNRANLTWDVDAIEVMATKEMFRIRTPTQPELDKWAAYVKDPDQAEFVSMAQMLQRDDQEQDALTAGTYTLGYGRVGQLDDWFSLLNLGFRMTALANSDSHGATSTEAGCPRNFVMSGTDDPAFVDDDDVASAVRAHRVVASFGPFVQLWLDDAMIGDELVSNAGQHTAKVEVQAPSWMDVDRVELYENGTLIHSWDVEGTDPQRFVGEVTVSPTRDSWYVAVAAGDSDMFPVITPVERPIIDLQVVVVEALSGVGSVANFLSPAVPMPETFPITPFAVTNPIWIDQDGDGFDAPGIPTWMKKPAEPAE